MGRNGWWTTSKIGRPLSSLSWEESALLTTKSSPKETRKKKMNNSTTIETETKIIIDVEKNRDGRFFLTFKKIQPSLKKSVILFVILWLFFKKASIQGEIIKILHSTSAALFST